MRRHGSPGPYLLLVMTLMLSAVPLSSLAQPAPNPCPEGEVFDVGQGVCVPLQDVPVDEEPGGGGQGTGNADLPPIFGLLLLHYVCDPGFDPRPARPSIGDRNVLCTGAGKPAATYTVAINGQPYTTVTLQTSEGTRGRAEVYSTPEEPMASGTMVIAAAPVDGWDDAWVFCEIESSIGEMAVVEPDIVDNAITLTLAEGDRATCDWFHTAGVTEGAQGGEDPGEADVPPAVDVEESAGPGADITLAAYNCPVGTTATADLAATCTERAAGLTFSLLTADTTAATQASDAEGDIFFEDVPPNDYGISTTLPAGYGEPIVICYHSFPNGIVEEGAEDIVLGNQFRFTVFGDGEFLECAWYNVPALGADTGPNIFIEAHTCGTGTTISSSMTVFDVLELCPSFYINLEFSVLNVDQVLATARTNEDFLSPGQVFFTKLPEPQSGAYAVVAHVVEGENTLAVFCDQDVGDGNFQVVPVRVTGNRMDQELGMGAGDTMRCSWFVEWNPLLAGTHPPDSPAQEGASGEAAEESTTDDPGAPSLAPSADQATPDAADPGETLVDPQEGQASPASNAGEDQAGSEASGEPGITVRALRCPADVAGQDVALDELCTEPASGMTFEIFVDDEAIGTSVTDANGQLAIPAEAGPGVYLFRHQPAPDHLEVKTECTAVYADGATATGQSRAVGSEMSEIYLTYDGASRVTCTFYFVMDAAASETGDSPEAAEGPVEDQATPPAEAGEGNAGASNAVVDVPAVTVQFLVCPAGTDPAIDPEELAQVCAVETVERSFILTLDGVSSGQTMTGSATWVPTDLTVYVDLGVAPTSQVRCTSDWVEGADMVPATSMLDGGLLTITLPHAETVVSCNWFLFPE